MTYLWSIAAAPLALMNSSVEPPAPPEAPTTTEATAPIEAVAPNLANPSTQVLGVEEDRNNRLTVPVTIGGAGPFDFMIDTGSQATAVTHEINQNLSLPAAGTATLVAMASERSVEVVELDNLKVGEHEISGLISPLLHRQHVGADGIIGLDSLQDLRVMIDFRAETISVEDVSSAASKRGFEIIVRAKEKLGQLLITDAVVEGVRATVIIDTGAQASLANNALRDRIRTKRAAEVLTTDVNGVSIVGQLSYVRSLTIGGMTLKDIPLTFADAPAFEALGLQDKPVLSLGMQHLALFDRVAIDFSRKRILFDVPRDVAKAMREARRVHHVDLR
jgi:predicted aspartyl protease